MSENPTQGIIYPPNTKIKPILQSCRSFLNTPQVRCPLPGLKRAVMPPRSHRGGEGLAGGKRSSLTGVARFFKDGGHHRYGLLVPLSLEKQIYDVGKKNGYCPWYLDSQFYWVTPQSSEKYTQGQFFLRPWVYFTGTALRLWKYCFLPFSRGPVPKTLAVFVWND